MKKLFAILLVLALTVCAAAFAEEEEWVDFADLHPEARSFDSYWVSGDAQVRVNGFCRSDAFEMIIVEMTSDRTFNAWEYIMTYDDDTHMLICDGDGLKSVNTFENGEIVESHNEYENGSASFFLDDDGNLYWDDAMEDTFQATVFHKIGYFPDFYACDRAMIEVRYAGEDLRYDVVLDWANSASETWSWSLSGDYDPATDTLPVSGYKHLYTYNEGGELDLDADQQETEVTAVFTVDENRNLFCSSDDESIDGMTFERSWGNMWQWEF